MKGLAILCLGAALAACASKPVVLRNADGQTVDCGSRSGLPNLGPNDVHSSEDDCVRQYESRGYTRVPSQ